MVSRGGNRRSCLSSASVCTPRHDCGREGGIRNASGVGKLCGRERGAEVWVTAVWTSGTSQKCRVNCGKREDGCVNSNSKPNVMDAVGCSQLAANTATHLPLAPGQPASQPASLPPIWSLTSHETIPATSNPTWLTIVAGDRPARFCEMSAGLRMGCCTQHNEV